MNTEVEQYIAKQPADRHNILSGIHSIIMEEDEIVRIGLGEIEEERQSQESIVYVKTVLQYHLVSCNNYMVLHLMPFYAYPALNQKYKLLLPKAIFEKNGCIRFTSGKDMPLDIVRQLISECSTFDVKKFQEECRREENARRYN